MFTLVYDVDKYSEFLPWCAGGKILRESGDKVDAKIDIAFNGLDKSFSTRNSICRFDSIDMELLDGPFKYLHGKWRFTELAHDKSKVELDMTFEFDGFILGKIAGPIFGQIAGSMLNAFVARAEVVYG